MTTNLSLETITAVIHVMVRVLAKHVLCFVALIMTFTLFCWSLWLGTWMGVATAGLFGVGIFLPVLWRTMKKGESDGHHEQ